VNGKNPLLTRESTDPTPGHGDLRRHVGGTEIQKEVIARSLGL